MRLRQNLHDAPCDRLGIVGWEGVGDNGDMGLRSGRPGGFL